MSSSATVPQTCQELALQLGAVGLLTSAELDPIVAALGANANGQSLVEKLVADGRLTSFQAQAILEGRLNELVVGNYEILAKIGAGGMGTVFKARHRRMKRIVALKVMSRQLCNDNTSVQRFQREVETIARLSHPNIVLAYDADEAEIGHFLVMEFVDGRDLASVVERNGPMTMRDAVSCIVQAAHGLEFAHAQSIVHRDIKPANLLRDPLGMVKVTDLGLARLSQSVQATADTGVTQAGGIVGTLDYMSPEQALDSTTIDHRTDIYSLGCTLYFLLQGKPPYHGKTSMATLLLHRDAPIPSLSESCPDTPPALEAAFRKMVAEDRDKRFQTMGEVAAALLAVPLPQQESRPGTLVPSGSDAGNQSTFVPNTPNTDQTAELPPQPDLKPEVKAEPEPAPPPAIPAAITALLVESSRAQAAIIKKYLDALGIETAMASTVDEAISQARNHKPDVVLSAMFLKSGTGTQVGQGLIVQFPFDAPPFVLITSQEESKNVGSLSQCGTAVLLHKPFSIETLAETLSGLLKRPLSAGEGSTSSGPVITTKSTIQYKRPSTDRSAFRVLVVDDSAVARANEKKVLQTLGISRIVETMDGAQAVAAVVQQKFDLVVTDYNMPLMDGAALIGYLRGNAATSSIPIILVTTETDEAKLAAVRKLGVLAVCPKSFPVETIRPLIESLIG